SVGVAERAGGRDDGPGRPPFAVCGDHLETVGAGADLPHPGAEAEGRVQEFGAAQQMGDDLVPPRVPVGVPVEGQFGRGAVPASSTGGGPGR
ncbi:hypothetical protein, partial [Streptomyces alkaliphilus]